MNKSEMFREGYYLEIIKAKQSAATAVITVKEKTVEVKKKKVTTNKWLTLDDWASLYEVLEKALIQNSEKTRLTEKKKFTRHLEIAYTFEASENPSDRTSLPTIRVGVSPVRKKSRRKSLSTGTESNIDKQATAATPSISLKSKRSARLEYSPSRTETYLEGGRDVKVEEYIPDAPNTKRIDPGSEGRSKLRYVPSRKSTLQLLQQSAGLNEYVPAVVSEEAVTGGVLDALYVPNSIPRTENLYETYEPSSSLLTKPAAGEYIPNSKGVRKKVDEYQPDFTSKTMKFDNSYIPSSSQKIKELKKNSRKSRTRDSERIRKESSVKKNPPLTQSVIKREM